MAIELVDGHSGKGHIGGDDKGSLHAGIVGRESVALDVGSVLACSMAGANAATVGTGDVLVHGRHVRVTAPERVTIASGTQGQRRNDVIAVRYHRAGDVETAALEVVKGTASDQPKDPPMPSDGSALDGAADDYMPLWRIPIDGINAGEPQRLFRVADTVSSLRRGIDRAMGTDEKPPADWNAAKSGAYVVSSIGTHGPAGVYQWGYLVVHRMDAGTCLQFYVTDKVTNVYARSQYGGSWSEWEHVYAKYGRSMEAR